MSKSKLAVAAALAAAALTGCSTTDAEPVAAPAEPTPVAESTAPSPPTDWEEVSDRIEQNLVDQLPSDRRISCLQWTLSTDQEKQSLIEEAAVSNYGDTVLTDEQKEALGTGITIGFMRGCEA